mmetsp:Transcript_19919/g.55514  ORF Transcript_19919/g.55514 Transcript_19919/m.55514 type:complete len:80 (+) Transcript_19919:343-582(+)
MKKGLQLIFLHIRQERTGIQPRPAVQAFICNPVLSLHGVVMEINVDFLKDIKAHQMHYSSAYTAEKQNQVITIKLTVNE